VGGRAPGLASGDGRTFAGSDPASWRRDDTPNGISDMVGNVWEWMDGLKLNRGRIYMPNDDNYPPPEA
jgi:formylglycine-generating enzyme required for sulfatase activity